MPIFRLVVKAGPPQCFETTSKHLLDFADIMNMRWIPDCAKKTGLNLAAWIFILLALFMNSCASTSQPSMPPIKHPTTDSAVSYPSTLEQQLRSEVHKWVGTPHRMGGTDHSGIDCSGFVQRIYKDVFGLQLPRTTAGQVQYGKKITDQSLQTGDLVFFRPSRRVRHVGIYLGEGEFAHASKTKGVMVSRMDDPYWRHVYWTSRRVLSESP